MTDITAIRTYLGSDWTAVQDLIKQALHSDITLLEMTNSTILEHSGKQLRPLLALLIAKACATQDLSRSARYAAAAELLHNATLLHDDVADESDTRRGFPTVKALLGPSASVLVGDFWLSKAVDLIFKTEEYEKTVGLFSSVLSDLAEGEMLQLQKASSVDTTLDDYIRIIYCKTASLFKATCESAAIAAGAGEEVVAAAREYAVNLGIAFQIKDDIMDYSSSDIGKPVGVDIKEGKITLPLLGAMANASAAQEEQMRAAIKQIRQHPEGAEMIMDFVREHGGVEYARCKLQEFLDKATDALRVFPESQSRVFLSELAEYVADRKI